MRSLFHAATRSNTRARIERLTPTHRPAWGHFSAPQMLAHLTDGLRMALGELPCREKRVPLVRHFPVKQLVLHWLPFPKGAPTAPELLARTPEEWTSELSTCLTLLDRFAGTQLPTQWPSHPLFGPLSKSEWGVLAYRHLDHHLRQFGV